MKDNKFLLGIIVGVLVCAILGGCFYLGTRFANKDDKKDVPDTKEETKKEENAPTDEFKSLSLDDKLVKEAVLFDASTLCGSPINEYDQKSRTIDEISDKIKMEMIVSRYIDEIIRTVESDDGDSTFDLKEEDLKRYFKDLSFLKKYEGKNTSFDSYPSTMTYKNGVLSFKGYPTGCEGLGEGYHSQVISAKKNSKQLIFKVITYYLGAEYDEKEDKYVYSTYKDHKSKTAIEEDVKFDESTFQYILNNELYDQYEYVIDISEGNLQLEAINYVK